MAGPATNPIPAPGEDPAAGPSDDPSHLTPLREMQLVEAHRGGDRESLAELLRAYQRRVYAICHRMLGDAEEARDLAQDSLLKVMEGLAGYDGRSKLSTWVFRVTMNCCLSHLRKQRLRRHASIDDAADGTGESWAARLAGPGEPSGAERIEQGETQARLLAALGTIDPQMRAILVLRDLHELDYQQIGVVLDVPVGTVKSRLFRARTALRTAVERTTGADAREDELS